MNTYRVDVGNQSGESDTFYVSARTLDDAKETAEHELKRSYDSDFRIKTLEGVRG